MTTLPVGPEYSYVVVYWDPRKTGRPLGELYVSIEKTLTDALGPANEQGFFLKDGVFAELKANDARTTIIIRFVTSSLSPIINLIQSQQKQPTHIVLHKTPGGIERIFDVSVLKSAATTQT